MVKRMLRKVARKIYVVILSERGSMDQMTWVLGSAVIVALVVVVLIAAAKGQATTWWTDITTWIQGQLGF
jgi:cell division septation protein DedD